MDCRLRSLGAARLVVGAEAKLDSPRPSGSREPWNQEKFVITAGKFWSSGLQQLIPMLLQKRDLTDKETKPGSWTCDFCVVTAAENGFQATLEHLVHC